MKTIMNSLLSLLSIITLLITSNLNATNGTFVIEKKELPVKVVIDLVKYIDNFNQKFTPLDSLAPYDPRIEELPKSGYYFQEKYLIPVSKAGTNFTFTIFLLWDEQIKECFTTDGFGLDALKQIKNFPLLKAYYYAGCCDRRYLATGIISLYSGTPKLLFILPSAAKNEEIYSSPYVYADFHFKLVSNINIKEMSNSSKFKFEVTYWFLKPDFNLPSYFFVIPESSDAIINLMNNSPADLNFTINYDATLDSVFLPENEQRKIKFLSEKGWPDNEINGISLIQPFLELMRENKALLED